MNVDRASDTDLAASVASIVSRPRRDPDDSFVLHAPLELVARLALLPRIRPDARREARARIRSIADQYEAFGPPAVDVPTRDFESTPDAARSLVSAVDAGDLDGVDAAATWLGRAAHPLELRELLADAVIPRLAAAGHAPIFLYHLPHVSPRGELRGDLLRPLARELARWPDWRLAWFEAGGRSTIDSAGALFDAFARTPSLGLPGSDFIFPVMSQAESSGAAADVLGGVVDLDVDVAARVILRAAALTMLQEPSDHAPYGWTHCLTLPQAVLGIAASCADRSMAVTVAATYVVGFRAAMANRPLVEHFSPTEHAAATVWHCTDSELGEVVTDLATAASVHHDAHLVKYTLACLDAAEFDASHRRLYLAAAASLGAYWADRDSRHMVVTDGPPEGIANSPVATNPSRS